MPPTAVESSKLTVLDAKSFPFESTSLKVTSEISVRSAPPVPFNAITGSVTSINCKKPIFAGDTLIVVFAETVSPPVITVAVIISPPTQVKGRYVERANPPILVTVSSIDACPELTQPDENSTVNGVVYNSPSLEISIEIRAVAPAANSSSSAIELEIEISISTAAI